MIRLEDLVVGQTVEVSDPLSDPYAGHSLVEPNLNDRRVPNHWRVTEVENRDYRFELVRGRTVVVNEGEQMTLNDHLITDVDANYNEGRSILQRLSLVPPFEPGQRFRIVRRGVLTNVEYPENEVCTLVANLRCPQADAHVLWMIRTLTGHRADINDPDRYIQNVDLPALAAIAELVEEAEPISTLYPPLSDYARAQRMCEQSLALGQVVEVVEAGAGLSLVSQRTIGNRYRLTLPGPDATWLSPGQVGFDLVSGASALIMVESRCAIHRSHLIDSDGNPTANLLALRVVPPFADRQRVRVHTELALPGNGTINPEEVYEFYADPDPNYLCGWMLRYIEGSTRSDSLETHHIGSYVHYSFLPELARHVTPIDPIIPDPAGPPRGVARLLSQCPHGQWVRVARDWMGHDRIHHPISQTGSLGGIELRMGDLYRVIHPNTSCRELDPGSHLDGDHRWRLYGDTAEGNNNCWYFMDVPDLPGPIFEPCAAPDASPTIPTTPVVPTPTPAPLIRRTLDSFAVGERFRVLEDLDRYGAVLKTGEIYRVLANRRCFRELRVSSSETVNTTPEDHGWLLTGYGEAIFEAFDPVPPAISGTPIPASFDPRTGKPVTPPVTFTWSVTRRLVHYRRGAPARVLNASEEFAEPGEDEGSGFLPV